MLCEWTSPEDLAAVRAAGPSGGYDVIIGADICYGQQALPAVRELVVMSCPIREHVHALMWETGFHLVGGQGGPTWAASEQGVVVFHRKFVARSRSEQVFEMPETWTAGSMGASRVHH